MKKVLHIFQQRAKNIVKVEKTQAQNTGFWHAQSEFFRALTGHIVLFV